MWVETLAYRILTGKMAPYVAGGVVAVVGAYLGLNGYEIMLVLLVAYAVGFFGPYQIRRLIRLWKNRDA